MWKKTQDKVTMEDNHNNAEKVKAWKCWGEWKIAHESNVDVFINGFTVLYVRTLETEKEIAIMLHAQQREGPTVMLCEKQ